MALQDPVERLQESRCTIRNIEWDHIEKRHFLVDSRFLGGLIVSGKIVGRSLMRRFESWKNCCKIRVCKMLGFGQWGVILTLPFSLLLIILFPHRSLLLFIKISSLSISLASITGSIIISKTMRWVFSPYIEGPFNLPRNGNLSNPN